MPPCTVTSSPGAIEGGSPSDGLETPGTAVEFAPWLLAGTGDGAIKVGGTGLAITVPTSGAVGLAACATAVAFGSVGWMKKPVAVGARPAFAFTVGVVRTGTGAVVAVFAASGEACALGVTVTTRTVGTAASF